MKHAEEAQQRIEAGEENEVQGLLEQWLRGRRMTETEALLSATDMFTAGVDSVKKMVIAVRQENVLTILFYTN